MTPHLLILSAGAVVSRPRAIAERTWLRVRRRYLDGYQFIHINKCGGTSIERALRHNRENHSTAFQRRREVGPKRWERCFTFSIVRNPFDRIVSQYEYRRKTNQTLLGTNPITFDEWVRRVLVERDEQYLDNPKMFRTQFEWLADREGKIMVDYVGRFEMLQQSFAHICECIHVSRKLPHLKSSRKRRPYPEYYESEETRKAVEQYFAEDLEEFGYAFDG